VLEKREIPLPEKLGFVLILDGLRDPGNLGAILRTADSAAVELVFLTPNSVDPFSPKVVRAGMGAHFHLPVQEASWEDIDGCIQTNGLRVYLASPDDGTQYYRTDFHQPFALIIGGEAQGASNLAFQTSDQRVHIPMPGGSESLNAGAAAAILLFEAVRQREVAN
jgi:TrmH family RNA methyltransferase